MADCKLRDEGNAIASSPQKTGTARSNKKTSTDAVSLRRADHKHVADLFSQFEKASASTRKAKLVEEICKELTVHAHVEEEILYPAFCAATRDKELVSEATVEHQAMKDLIAQVQGVASDGEMYDARVKVLGENVKHHV